MMAENMERIIGPRVSAREFQTHRVRYLIPTLLFVVAAVLLVGSIFQPYWRLTLHAPQYPKGLHVVAYLDRLEGDVAEIDGLNHYIGMRPLNEAAQFERSISLIGVAAVALLILAAIFVHSKWAALLSLPALLFPAIFLLDLQYWMANFGQNLDPRAPLSSSIKPFVPPVLFEGKIAQFRTWAEPEWGLWLAAAGSLVILIGLFFHRRAYKPLVDAQSGQ
jgi:peptidoglycan/LPS O-acetylase OafA/YrhL